MSGRPRYRHVPNTPTATDQVDRQFARGARDQLWVTDITEHPTREGKVYCAVVLDVFSRRVVGWSIDASPTAALVTNALGMAIGHRKPTGGTVIHSDHGTQFTSWAFTRRALDSGLVPSMGSIGDCFDNAVIESFWSRLQVELLDRKRWRTRLELSNARLIGLHRSVEALSPARVLDRGYAVVRTVDGSVVRRAADVGAGTVVSVTVAEGTFAAEVRP